ncbi:Holliday junction branch migration protein RuvA [Candidatus Giovannonibacteria bacterium]|nr:Holliday junction branch migration protein RuvA [Candidatus Giovannonibacteria bacterium]
MLGYLEGKISFRGERYLIIDVAGVGYKVFVNAETLKNASKTSEKIKVWTHLYQREDALELYGFLSQPELELFETLLSVPGVGPRTALGILNVAPIDTLKRAIASGELSYLTKVSGIGRKTAEKIMVELREKFGKAVSVGSELKEEQDALEALESLGYSAREAREALRQVPGSVEGTSRRVQGALKILGGSKS